MTWVRVWVQERDFDGTVVYWSKTKSILSFKLQLGGLPS